MIRIHRYSAYMKDQVDSWVTVHSVVAPSDSVAEQFETDVKLIGDILYHLTRDTAHIEPPPVHIRVVKDLRAEVSRILDPEGVQASWSNERLGGKVAAKNLADPEREGGSLILFDSELTFLDDEALVGNPRISRLFLVAHELVHPIQRRIREVSGVLEGVHFPSETPQQLARSMTRVAVDEFRADIIAGTVLGNMVMVESPKSAPRPAAISDTFALSHVASTEEIISDLYPSIPDLVDSYRIRETDLDSMWSTIVQRTDQLLTQLAHSEAVCYLLQLPDILEIEAIAQLPASGLYVGRLWKPIRDRLRDFPALLTPDELAQNEPVILESGQSAVFDFWAQIGLHPSSVSSDQDYVRVTAPTR